MCIMLTPLAKPSATHLHSIPCYLGSDSEQPCHLLLYTNDLAVPDGPAGAETMIVAIPNPGGHDAAAFALMNAASEGAKVPYMLAEPLV